MRGCEEGVAYGAPAVADGVDKGPREDGREQVPEGIALLEHTGDETASFLGAIFKRYNHIVSNPFASQRFFSAKTHPSPPHSHTIPPSQSQTTPSPPENSRSSSRTPCPAPAR